MTKPSQLRLTWFKASLLVILTLVVSLTFGIGMASLRIVLISPFLKYTWLFHAALGLIPAGIVLASCIMQHPSGSPISLALLTLLSGLILFVYVALVGPSLPYSEVECSSTIYSGWVLHQDCVCKAVDSSDAFQAKCSFDSLTILPFAQLTEHK